MNVKSKEITFTYNGKQAGGYLAEPEADENFPGVITIQEWWGLVPHIKNVAERFAGEGFIALAPDLYHGQTANEPDEARKLAMELDRDQATEEISAAIHYLQQLDRVWPKKIGVVGWCMGGALALSSAATDGDVGAVVVFYGPARDLEQISRIKAPILGLYGEHDQGIPLSMVSSLEQTLAENDVPHEIHVYPGAGHAFFNDERPQIYHPQAAEDAWRRTLAWFRTHLAPSHRERWNKED
jgi:carboxymethylenebutenolidase